MKKEGFDTAGAFAKKAHVTLRTIRWYDEKNILKPSYRDENGVRYYTDADLAKLQQILLFKYLGFSLDDIREMTLASEDTSFLMGSLEIQKKLVQERISEMNDVLHALDETTKAVQEERSVNWDGLLNLIHMTSADQSLKTQYQNAANVSARIRLHKEFSTNKQGWFPWIFEQIPFQSQTNILEIGCGNGALWIENREQIPEHTKITLTDISEGMLRDALSSIGKDLRFSYRKCDAKKLPFEDGSFDVVIANHMLFYCDDIHQVLKECKRVLKKNGVLLCSTYGKNHMKEITELVQSFDAGITLSSEALYEKFGLENGGEILYKHYKQVELIRYPDSIELHEAEPLIAYIISCHGNQNHILLDQYKEFREYVQKQCAEGFHITKDAGLYICRKS